jgi:L-alanine-DL-glutamate epimerase-like enolase superfamily enzyme
MILNYLSGESGRYPWELLSLGAPVGIRNSITISLDKPEDVIENIKSSEYSIIKIKMGGEHDAELIPLLREITGKEIRVDANGGWEPETAEEMIHFLSEMGIHVIEQPTDLDHVADWPHLKGKNKEVELFVDEGLNTIDDYERLAERCDGVNIKMEKSGGIVEAMRIAARAREDKKKVMLGCMVESSVGIAQSVYMSAMADYHDLDSPQLLEDDIAQGITFDKDTIQVDREIIGGPALKRDVVEKYIRD